MSSFSVQPLFPIPIIAFEFKKHYKYKFKSFPKKDKIPNGWNGSVYSTFPNIEENDEFVDYSVIQSLKKDLKKSINEIFLDLEIKTNWYFQSFWYNCYYGDQEQERHRHLPSPGGMVPLWSGIYYNLNPTPTVFYRDACPFLSSSNPNPEFYGKLKEYYYHNWYPFLNEGFVLIFPPSLEHSVPPTNSDNMRLTFSFNINLNE